MKSRNLSIIISAILLTFYFDSLAQISGGSFTATCTDAGTVSWIAGPNTTLIFAKAESAIVEGTPSDNINSYTASATLGNGTPYEHDADAFCVFKNNSGNSFTLTGLTPGVTYHFLAFTANGTNYSASHTFNGTSLSTPPNATSENATPGANQVNLSWTNPSCMDQILIVAKEGSSIDGVPTGDGSAYTANSDFAAGGTTFDGTGKVVYKNNTTSGTVTGLAGGGTYYFRIFTRKGTSWSGGVETSVTLPLSNVTGASFQATCTNAGTVSWTNPSNTFRILVFVKEASAITVSTPTEDESTFYTTASSTFGNGDPYEHDGNAFLIYSGTGTSVSLSGLTTGTVYHFLILNANGTDYSSGATFNNSTATGPEDVSNITPVAAANSIAISWTNPTVCFDEIMVVAKTTAIGASPSGDGSAYTADANFGGGGTTFDGDGKVVFKGGGTSVNITALASNTQYFFKVFTRLGSTWSTGSSGDATTLCVAANVTGLGITDGATTANLSWTNSSCFDEVMVVAKEGTRTTASTFTSAVPSGNSYVANANFTSGASSVFDGGKVVYKASGTSASVTNLQTGTIYTFKVFTRKGDDWSNGVVIETVPGPPVAISSTPGDGATGVSTAGPFVITFNEDVFISSSSGQNNIVFNPNSGSSTSIAKGSADISISGKVVTITPSSALLANKTYQVQIGNTVFSDGTNNFGGQSSDAWAAGTAVNIWDFVTEQGITPNNPTAGVCDGQFAVVPNIVLQEAGNANFPGQPELTFTMTLGIEPSSGFIFDPGATVQVLLANSTDQVGQGDLGSATVGSITYSQLPITFTFKAGQNNNAVRARTDKVTISGIKISSDGTGTTPAYIVIKSITNGVAIAGIENNVTPLATIESAEAPIAAFDQNTRTSFIVNEAPYLLSGASTESDGITPSTGTDIFSGTGVTQHGDGNYYFYPSAAGVQDDLPITLTHTNSAGCSHSVTIEVDVSSEQAILNLLPLYCFNGDLSDVLEPNPAAIGPIIVFYTEMRVVDMNKNPIPIGHVNYPLSLVSTGPNKYRLDPEKAYRLFGEAEFRIVIYGQFFGEFEMGEGITRIAGPGPRPGILSIPAGQICNSSEPVKLEASTDTDGYTSVNYAAYYDGPFDPNTSVPVTPNPISQPSVGEFFYNPGTITYQPGERDKRITIVYNYLDKSGCAGQVQKSFWNDRKPAQPVGLDATYCQFYEDPLYLTAEGEYGNLRWYEQQDLNAPIVWIGPVFNTGLSSLSPLAKQYYVVDWHFSCTSDFETVQIEVAPVPPFDLDIPPQCEGKEVAFEGPDGADSYFWILDADPITGEDITSDEQNPIYTYEKQGVKDVRLTISYLSNENQCNASKSTKVTVGVNPEPTFTYSQICDGEFTQFDGIAAENIGVVSFSWNFGDGLELPKGNSLAQIPAGTHGGLTTNVYENPHHQFVNASAPASYDVTVTAYTNLGCFGSLMKNVTIVPFLSVTSENTYNMNDLDNGAGFWTIERFKGEDVLWEFVQPSPLDPSKIINIASASWITNESGNYPAETEGALNSPCFDVSSLVRPIISLDYILNTEERTDGVVLEYSVDGGITWTTLGGFDSGLNWFNSISFKSGKIGNSITGWSGENGYIVNDQGEIEWLVGRNSLDDIPVVSRGKVRFRLYFYSDQHEEHEGFAFNNFRIEERNRIILVENFTNQSPSNSKYVTNNERYDQLSTDELVKIQYHIGYPGTDEIFNQNTADPSARAAFYGISNTLSLVPRAYLDGYSNGDLIGPWSNDFLQKQTLKPSPLKLSIETIPTGSNDLHVKLNYTPTEDILATPDRKLNAFLAIIEKTVGTNKYVVRKLLPSAVGIPLTLPLFAADGEQTVTIEPWHASLPGVDFTNVALVGFIQDENTKEVYQAVLLENPANLPNGVITETETTLSSQVKVYPNPSDDEVYVVLPQNMQQAVPLKLIDSFGRQVHQSIFNKGEQSKGINTKDLAAGVYIIQLETTQGLVRKKVMVVH